MSGLVTYCMMSVLLNCSEVNFLFFFLNVVAFGALTRLPQPRPNTPGSFSTCSPGGSSSSGYGCSYSSSGPCQDDCMRPVRRLPVSDLPWWEADRAGGRWGRQLSECLLVKSLRFSVGGKVREKETVVCRKCVSSSCAPKYWVFSFSAGMYYSSCASH